VSVPKVESSAWPVTGRVRRAKLTSVLPLMLALFLVRPAWAQTQQLNQIQQVPAGSPIERVVPKQLPPVAPGGVTSPMTEELEVPNVPPIAVRQVDLVGAHLFDAELAPGLQGLRGPATSLNELNKARQGILLYYRTRGYPLVAVSMHIDRPTGHVTYLVTEGRIVDVKLEGDPGGEGDIGPAGQMVLKILRKLTEPEVIDSATLERYLLLAQDVPGVSLSTVLNPSTTDPGALTLIAQVSRSGLKIPGAPYGSISGQFSMDNRAFDLTGPIEFLGVVDINALTAWGDKTEFAFFHTFPNSQNFGQVSSEFIVNPDGWKVKVYGGAGVNYPTGSLGALKYAGFTDIFGAQASYVWLRTRQQSLTVYAGLDALESTIDTGSPSVQSSADEVRVLRIGEDFTRWDNLVGNLMDSRQSRTDPGAVSTILPATNVLQVKLSRGLDFLGGFHGTALPPSTARQGEQHNFTAIKFEASRTQTIFYPWDGASVAVMALVTGQYSPSILPPSEEFYLGGSRFTRGFYSGQVPGDKALAATAELQLNTLLDLSWFHAASTEVQSQFYLFYDWGEVWENLAADFASHLASAGGGVRMQVTKNVEVDLEALGRLTVHPPPATSDMNGIGLYWRVVGRF
jgi:hemolysin activation/secretion protein